MDSSAWVNFHGRIGTGRLGPLSPGASLVVLTAAPLWNMLSVTERLGLFIPLENKAQ